MSVGAPHRTWQVLLRCHYADRTLERQVMISESKAELRLGVNQLPSRAFSVYEDGELLGVQVSPAESGLKFEGIAARLAEMLKCDRVEQLTTSEVEAP